MLKKLLSRKYAASASPVWLTILLGASADLGCAQDRKPGIQSRPAGRPFQDERAILLQSHRPEQFRNWQQCDIKLRHRECATSTSSSRCSHMEHERPCYRCHRRSGNYAWFTTPTNTGLWHRCRPLKLNHDVSRNRCTTRWPSTGLQPRY